MDIDARGPRFGAIITTVVLALALATTSVWLLLAQTLVFAVGAIAGMRYAPYGLVLPFPGRGPAWDRRCVSSPRRPRGSRRPWAWSSPRSA